MNRTPRQRWLARHSGNKSGVPWDRRKRYLYRGIFHCGECGRLITTETQKGHNSLRCTKWKVPCSQPFVREETIAAQVTQAIRGVALPVDWADWMLEQAQELRAEASQTAEAQRQAHEKAIRPTETKLDRVMTGYLEGVLTLDEYRLAKTNWLTKSGCATSNSPRSSPADRPPSNRSRAS